MALTQDASERLLLRAMLPSIAGLIGSFFILIMIMAVHVLLLSVQAGTLWSEIYDGYFSIFYTNVLVQPLLTLFHSSVVGVLASALVWSLAGGILYALVEWGVYSVRNFRAAERNIQYAGKVYVEHPLQRNFLIRAVIRLFIGLGLVALVVVALPYLQFLSNVDHSILLGTAATAQVVAQIGEALLIGIGLLHAFIVLLRLYNFRTRLFGEILY
ncbi:MAG TPA: hypothetical protein VLG11_01130 [Candidatus Saccharimonadales bacterium]|nr:hypothetical protein [Candidatus Saccharimonadales bacterium]